MQIQHIPIPVVNKLSQPNAVAACRYPFGAVRRIEDGDSNARTRDELHLGMELDDRSP